jgi:cytochrome P450
MEFAGVQLQRGAKVVCVLGSPNRDPAIFERPDEFDLTRPAERTRKHYRTFGFGPHHCLGMAQARLNLTVMVEEIAKHLYRPRLLGEPRTARSIFMDGFKEMHIAFEIAA